jgi:lipopolysaccharide transport protein LptA
MRNKHRNLRIIFILFCTSLALPVYYISSIVTEELFFKKFINEVISEKSSIEYFNFIGLEGVLHEKFGNNQYTIYAFADQSKGIGEISRNNIKELTLEQMEISNAHGTAQNTQTQDVYNFEGTLMNVSESRKTVRLYQDFNIKLKRHKENSILEMRGDNITFDTLHSSIYSDAPVIMQNEGNILIGGNFLFANNTVTMQGDIFIDSPNVIITSDALEILLDDTKNFSNGTELIFKKAIFSGKAKMFDKINNVNAFANKITIDYNKKLAILEGNARIERANNVATGSVLTYNLDSGIANLKSNKNTRVQLFINY